MPTVTQLPRMVSVTVAQLSSGFPTPSVAFEERNPTSKNLAFVGFHCVQPPMQLKSGNPPTQVAPQPTFIFISPES
ncbi:hypothetical protein LC593_36030 [Nostoc sp. CHAB 5844]|nr:hypothetical protein [Nostoc sp. CHAB 5844]